MTNGSKASLLEVALVLLVLGLWWVFPERLTWQPLTFALPLAAVRLVSRQPLLKDTALNFSTALWIATAGLGAWAAYDRAEGLKLFALIAGGILVYYTLAGLASESLWTAASIICGLSSGLAGYFLFSQDWLRLPADIALINVIGRGWMLFRPSLALQPFHPNMVAGILASTFPLALASVFHHKGSRVSWQLFFAVFFWVMISAGLVMTSSRAAWAVLALCLGLWWALWRWQAKIFRTIQPVFVTLLALSVLAVFIAGVFVAGRMGASGLDQSGSLGSRLELYGNSTELARDVFWIGGGLGSFAGLYSSYILLLHVPMYFYSHNLYLDVLIEQGIFGLFAVLGLLLGSFGLLLSVWGQARQKNVPVHPLALPVLAGLAVIVLHGLVDNPFYEAWSRPLTTLLPGLSAAVAAAAVAASGEKKLVSIVPKIRRGAMLLTIGALGILLLVPAVRAAWQANMAGIDMAHRQLDGWPDVKQAPVGYTSSLAPVQNKFQQVLQLDPDNGTAHYRLGLIAYQEQDFTTAVEELMAAAQARPEHPGVRKALGLALTWEGQEAQAVEQLAGLPDIVEEMAYYTQWWQQQSRPDLSARAESMAARLAVSTRP